jgi:trehalose 6-phosphate phosphatase
MKDFDFSQIDHLKPWALFLDIDGTLCDFAATASAVVFPKALVPVLQRLHDQLGGALAIITGRSIESADRLFEGSGLTLPIAGLHGGEFRFADGYEQIDAPVASDEWRQQARAVAERLPGVIYEEKRFGFGLHYRFAPSQGPAVWEAMEKLVDGHPDFHLLPASMAVEVRPNGVDKGQAIERFMQHAPFKGRYPIFFGDDFTDEDGFHGVHMLRGSAVLVGSRTPSIAEYRVKDTETMRAMLTSLNVNLAANAA